MSRYEQLENLFYKAVEALPYSPTTTGCVMGDFEPEHGEYIEYSEEYIFDVGELFGDKLVAGGWIELRHEDGETNITAFLGVARNGDWQQGRILPEDTAVQGAYNLKSGIWEFWIDQY